MYPDRVRVHESIGAVNAAARAGLICCIPAASGGTPAAQSGTGRSTVSAQAMPWISISASAWCRSWTTNIAIAG